MIKLIYLPNKFEKYTAGLRVIFQNLILKNGIKKKYLINLGKIYENEAIFFDYDLLPIDTEKFFLSILKSVYIKKILQSKKPQISCETNGNYILNKKLVSILILKIAQNSDYIKIYKKRKKIFILTKGVKYKKIKKIIIKLHCLYFEEIKSKRQLIILAPEKTDKKAKDFEEDLFSLQNPLSPINYYL